MRAYKRWDASGTLAHVTVVGTQPADTTREVLYHEIADGVSLILDPVALIVLHADGHEERVAIQDVRAAEGQGV